MIYNWVAQPIKAVIAIVLMFSLVGCGPVKRNIENEYQLSSYSHKKYESYPSKSTLLVVKPQAVGGYQTSEMLYIKKPYELMSFAYNAWVDPPANMLFPLLLQSLNSANYFHAIDSTPYAKETTYRLDTLLLSLHQNFLTKPSTVQMSIKAVLSRSNDNQVIDSIIIKTQKPCPEDTPYGGVIAANEAVKTVTGAVTDFVIKRVKSQRG
ncbi:hypothetical protein [Legionella sp. W05-934-2]|jgi:cholesterol transport system auxiliary component|uniref:ABC-type transport auxiliary lipoprotein family protein n=1 Tax=Legionella sp. W05-934-2 TaxID=1198649 RepID=UPI003462CFC7